MGTANTSKFTEIHRANNTAQHVTTTRRSVVGSAPTFAVFLLLVSIVLLTVYASSGGQPSGGAMLLSSQGTAVGPSSSSPPSEVGSALPSGSSSRVSTKTFGGADGYDDEEANRRRRTHEGNTHNEGTRRWDINTRHSSAASTATFGTWALQDPNAEALLYGSSGLCAFAEETDRSGSGSSSRGSNNKRIPQHQARREQQSQRLAYGTNQPLPAVVYDPMRNSGQMKLATLCMDKKMAYHVAVVLPKVNGGSKGGITEEIDGGGLRAPSPRATVAGQVAVLTAAERSSSSSASSASSSSRTESLADNVVVTILQFGGAGKGGGGEGGGRGGGGGKGGGSKHLEYAVLHYFSTTGPAIVVANGSIPMMAMKGDREAGRPPASVAGQHAPPSSSWEAGFTGIRNGLLQQAKRVCGGGAITSDTTAAHDEDLCSSSTDSLGTSIGAVLRAYTARGKRITTAGGGSSVPPSRPHAVLTLPSISPAQSSTVGSIGSTSPSPPPPPTFYLTAANIRGLCHLDTVVNDESEAVSVYPFAVEGFGRGGSSGGSSDSGRDRLTVGFIAAVAASSLSSSPFAVTPATSSDGGSTTTDADEGGVPFAQRSESTRSAAVVPPILISSCRPPTMLVGSNGRTTGRGGSTSSHDRNHDDNNNRQEQTKAALSAASLVIKNDHYTKGGDMVVLGAYWCLDVGCALSRSSRWCAGAGSNSGGCGRDDAASPPQHDGAGEEGCATVDVAPRRVIIPFMAGGPHMDLLLATGARKGRDGGGGNTNNDGKSSSSSLQIPAATHGTHASVTLLAKPLNNGDRAKLFKAHRPIIDTHCSADPNNPVRVGTFISNFIDLKSLKTPRNGFDVLLRTINATALMTGHSDLLLSTNVPAEVLLGILRAEARGLDADTFVKVKQQLGGNAAAAVPDEGPYKVVVVDEGKEEEDKSGTHAAADVSGTTATDNNEDQLPTLIVKRPRGLHTTTRTTSTSTANTDKSNSRSGDSSGGYFLDDSYPNTYGELVITTFHKKARNSWHVLCGMAVYRLLSHMGAYDLTRYSEDDLYLSRDQFEHYCATMPFFEAREEFLNYHRFEAKWDAIDESLPNERWPTINRTHSKPNDLPWRRTRVDVLQRRLPVENDKQLVLHDGTEPHHLRQLDTSIRRVYWSDAYLPKLLWGQRDDKQSYAFRLTLQGGAAEEKRGAAGRHQHGHHQHQQHQPTNDKNRHTRPFPVPPTPLKYAIKLVPIEECRFVGADQSTHLPTNTAANVAGCYTVAYAFGQGWKRNMAYTGHWTLPLHRLQHYYLDGVKDDDAFFMGVASLPLIHQHDYRVAGEDGTSIPTSWDMINDGAEAGDGADRRDGSTPSSSSSSSSSLASRIRSPKDALWRGHHRHFSLTSHKLGFNHDPRKRFYREDIVYFDYTPLNAYSVGGVYHVFMEDSDSVADAAHLFARKEKDFLAAEGVGTGGEDRSRDDGRGGHYYWPSSKISLPPIPPYLIFKASKSGRRGSKKVDTATVANFAQHLLKRNFTEGFYGIHRLSTIHHGSNAEGNKYGRDPKTFTHPRVLLTH